MPRVTVGTAATVVHAGAIGGDGIRAYRVLLRNRAGSAMYFDTVSTLTTSTGVQLDDGESMSLVVKGTPIYAIHAVGSARCDVIATPA